jgi:hypothetical protein
MTSQKDYYDYTIEHQHAVSGEHHSPKIPGRAFQKSSLMMSQWTSSILVCGVFPFFFAFFAITPCLASIFGETSCNGSSIAPSRPFSPVVEGLSFTLSKVCVRVKVERPGPSKSAVILKSINIGHLKFVSLADGPPRGTERYPS